MSQQTTESYIKLPLDHYGHQGAPSEWWWHIGTLVAKDGRKFGFEINGAFLLGHHFTQIEITDVSSNKNYQKMHVFLLDPANWVEYDSSKPWYVKMIPLLTPFDGGVKMQQVGDNPLNMLVQASFIDAGVQCQMILNFNQEQNKPLLVWGTGRTPEKVNPEGKTPLEQYNFYYSLTNLRASGYIIIGSEVIEVTGLTWMDHQYGYFGNPASGAEGQVHWMLQDIQLPDGIHLSNSYVMKKDEQIIENHRYESYATVLFPSGESKLVGSYTTAMGPTFTENGIIYYMNFKVEIDDHGSGLNAVFHVKSLLDDQIFHTVNNYEGIGSVEATFGDSDVITTGTAWIEQTYGKPKSATRF